VPPRIKESWLKSIWKIVSLFFAQWFISFNYEIVHAQTILDTSYLYQFHHCPLKPVSCIATSKLSTSNEGYQARTQRTVFQTDFWAYIQEKFAPIQRRALLFWDQGAKLATSLASFKKLSSVHLFHSNSIHVLIGLREEEYRWWLRDRFLKQNSITELAKSDLRCFFFWGGWVSDLSYSSTLHFFQLFFLGPPPC
jgi:hypothetical protein